METMFYKCYVGEDAEKATTLTVSELKEALGKYDEGNEGNIGWMLHILAEVGIFRPSPFVFFCTEAFYNERVKTQ